MLDWIAVSKYAGVLAALVLAGFGAPIPEEIPIVTAGAMVGHDAQDVADYRAAIDRFERFDGRADAAAAVLGGSVEYFRPERPDRPRSLTRWWIMLPLCIVGVVLADCVLYTAGRMWGVRLLRSGWVQRNVLPPEKQVKIEQNFAKHGILILLGARLTPGIRTPVFLMAGVLKMPLARFLLADGLYAVPGVNLLFWLAYLFTDQFVAAIHAVERHRPMAVAVVLAAVGGVILYKLLANRKLSTGDVEEIPPYVKPVGKVTHAVEQAVEMAVEKAVQTIPRVVDRVTHPLGHHTRPAPAAESPAAPEGVHPGPAPPNGQPAVEKPEPAPKSETPAPG
jgi:membrane protein DedA with SNARE-associated domain